MENKKRRPRKGLSYIGQLESRLTSMEELLRKVLPEDGSLSTFGLFSEESTSSDTVKERSMYCADIPSSSDSSPEEAVSLVASSLGVINITDNGNSQEFHGCSSNISLLQQIPAFAKRCSDKWNTAPDNPDADITENNTIYPLPDRKTILRYVNAHVYSPTLAPRVVHRQWFLEMTQMYLDEKIQPRRSWMALLHIVLATGAESLQESDIAFKMFLNAYKFLSTDYWTKIDLMSVQAVVMIVIFLHNSNRISMANFTAGLAVK